MASMAIYLRSRPRSFLQASAPVYSSSSRSHFRSSSSSPDPRGENAQTVENNQSNSRTSWKDVRSHLRGARPLRDKPTSPVDMMEMRKTLSEFSRRSDAPSGVRDSQGEPAISFQELYKKRSENAAQSSGSADKEDSSILVARALGRVLREEFGKRCPNGEQGEELDEQAVPASVAKARSGSLQRKG